MRRHVPSLRALRNDRGNALVEFTLLLPLLLLVILGCSEICLLLERQVRLIHLSREAASVYSRGAVAEQTLQGIRQAEGDLGLDGESGEVILSRISRDATGNPVITERLTMGRLDEPSEVGDASGGVPAPAHVPNGRAIPPNTSLVVVELYSLQPARFVAPGIWTGRSPLVLRSVAVF